LREFLRLLRDPKAATAIEYAMIAAGIAVAAVVGIRNFAAATGNMWTLIGHNVTNNI
jgi:Flp pilus assembly pilin Flp